MKTYFPLRALLLLLAYFFCVPDGYGQGYLHQQGPKIVDGQGNEVILRGIGLGGWMLQEGYMLKIRGPQHQLEAQITDLVGEARKQEFYQAWLANHTRKTDIDSLAAWGYNSVRLPMHYKLFTPPIEEEPVPGQITWREEGFQMTDQLLAWCKANKLYLILDLHAAPGGQGKNADINDYDSSKPSLWENGANQEKTIALWRKLAERYANEPMIGGYDIINEPNWGFQDLEADPNGCAKSQNVLLWELQRKITAAIREVDQHHLVIIEGNCWGNNYAGLPQLWDNNMAISFHKYWNSNEQGAIQHMLDMRQNRNVPIWLGETGENANTWFTDAISLLERNGIGWAWWPLKKIGINNPLEVIMPPAYQKVVDYWNNPDTAPRPAADEAYQGLMQLAENLKLKNNIYHRDVVDAKIRQPHPKEAIPFSKNLIAATGQSRIWATDYDLGRHNVAYHDAEYTNTTGQAGGLAWNKGYAYRNDGVDIGESPAAATNGYYLGWTETGEWLQYTLRVAEAGHYSINISTAAVNAQGKISLQVNGTKASRSIVLPNTGGYQNWQQTTVTDVLLQEGANVLRVLIDGGGFNLNYLEFIKQAGPASAQPSLLEGSIKHQEKTILLVYSQHFHPISDPHGFTVTVNGTEVAVNGINLKEEAAQVIALNLGEPVAYGDRVKVSYAGGAIATVANVALAPFADVAIAVVTDTKILEVPGRIQAEDFTKNNGFQTEATTDTGGGLNVGYTDAGDYLEYQVFISQAGIYGVHYRVASQTAGGSLKLQRLHEGVWADLNTKTFQATGGWQSWQTISGQVSLPEGLQQLRILAASAGFNLNWFEFNYLRPTGFIDGQEQESPLRIYPNPTLGTFTVSVPETAPRPDKMLITDLSGKKIFSYSPDKQAAEFSINPMLSKGLYVLLFEIEGKQHSQKLILH